jgi:hypothetical protein
LRVWQRQQQYTADLIREFQLLTLDDESARHGLPGRLLEVADEFVVKYGTYSDALTAEREAALARGEVMIDASIPLLSNTPELIESVRTLLDDVEEYCPERCPAHPERTPGCPRPAGVDHDGDAPPVRRPATGTVAGESDLARNTPARARASPRNHGASVVA